MISVAENWCSLHAIRLPLVKDMNASAVFQGHDKHLEDR